jgi:hypothetical protein
VDNDVAVVAGTGGRCATEGESDIEPPFVDVGEGAKEWKKEKSSRALEAPS